MEYPWSSKLAQLHAHMSLSMVFLSTITFVVSTVDELQMNEDGYVEYPTVVGPHYKDDRQFCCHILLNKIPNSPGHISKKDQVSKAAIECNLYFGCSSIFHFTTSGRS